MKGPNFDIAFSIGKLHIYWYAILLALGIAVAMLFTDRRAKGRKVPKDIALDLCILALPFGILGGRLFACLSGMVTWNNFFDLSRPGLSFFGAMFFGAAAILVYLKHRKVRVGEMLDIAAPGIFAGIGISVWGDFFNRNHYGPLVQKASHKWFPLATFGSDLKIHYAAFFYEFLLCVVLIVLYYVVLRKMVQRKANRFLLMALIYCLGRFCIDAIRQDLVMVGPLAFDQICEIVVVVLCLALLLLKRAPEKIDEEEVEPSPATEGEATEKPDEASEPAAEQPEEAKEEAAVPSEPTEGDAPEEKTAEKPSPEAAEETSFSGLN